MSKILIQNGLLINEGTRQKSDILIDGGRIVEIGSITNNEGATVIDASGKWILPGVIDDQVHFREPGLTHKGEIATESRAAVAGGVTSFMEMPNTNPQTLTVDLLEEKFARAAEVSPANYSFFMGVSNDNLEEALKADPKTVCGLKVFMGSSTGNMLVDNEEVLRNIFSRAQMLVATHCEDEATVRANEAAFKEKYGEDVPIRCHPEIRSVEACYKSSSKAVELAKEFGTRLHILHISTAKEIDLFSNDKPLAEKRITAEACVHHLTFSDEDYDVKGTRIKWNPAVKSASDREAVFQAVLDDRIDVIATDHAPHTLEEKSNTYFKAPSGGPLVQHSLNIMLDFVAKGKISIEKVVEKMAHNPAILFQIQHRGYIRENFWADLVIVDPNASTTVTKENLLYKCGWSPIEGSTLEGKIETTIVSGEIAFKNGQVQDDVRGKRLIFDR
ncbi:MAG: dihydroorotase [Lentisphaeria bacterium]|nr:dihydroorotase [Lentisphaeria bacterium]